MTRKKYYEELGFKGEMLELIQGVETVFDKASKAEGTELSMDEFISLALKETPELIKDLTEREQYLLLIGTLMSELAEV